MSNPEDFEKMSNEELAKIAGIELPVEDKYKQSSSEESSIADSNNSSQPDSSLGQVKNNNNDIAPEENFAAKSDDELLKIAGITKESPPVYDSIPGRARVEKLITQREDALMKSINEVKDINRPGSISALGVMSGLGSRLESAIANPLMELQEAYKPNLIKRTLDSAIKGLTGERRGEFGDVPRRAGFDELSSAFIGLGVAGKLLDLPTRNGLVKNLNKVKDFVVGRIPRYGDKWILEQAQAAQDVAKGIRTSIGHGFDEIYGKIGKFSVDPTKVDEILLKSHLDDNVLMEIEDNFGSKIDTIEKLKGVVNIIRSRIPNSSYLSGKMSGKGGQANKVIQKMGTSRALVGLMDESIRPVDKEAADTLKRINDFYHSRVMPITDKIYSMVGREIIPKTEGLVTSYGNLLDQAQASKRYAIKEAPKVAKEIKNYINGSYKSEIANLVSDSTKLLRNMQAMRFARFTGNAAKVALLAGGGLAALGAAKKAFAEEPVDKFKKTMASMEHSGNQKGDWMQIEKSTFEDLKKRGYYNGKASYLDIKTDAKEYDKVADAFKSQLKKEFGLDTEEDMALWGWRPSWFKKYDGDIEKIPDDKMVWIKGKKMKAKDVMRSRVKNSKEN